MHSGADYQNVNKKLESRKLLIFVFWFLNFVVANSFQKTELCERTSTGIVCRTIKTLCISCQLSDIFDHLISYHD